MWRAVRTIERETMYFQHPGSNYLSVDLFMLHKLSGGLTIPQPNTGSEPNREHDMAGRFVPMVGFTQDDEGRNSHLSDIPLQLPSSATVAFDDSSSVTFLMRNVPSLHPIPSRTRVNPWQSQCPSTSVFTCGSWTLRNCSIGNTTSTKSSECSARNGWTCYASSTRISSCQSSI